ncbi:peroxisome proliferator-activated receptor gamma coactivator 1-alpha isoform X10 [Pangasianodon hypophthalmus]|uniref:peroxisome proliferator-activated receptor gamma coactivator 1-alpha isoform X10 n=1 Tax=Pangasianodon hypophthalmus TaxID=310915 RepID=UPI000EFDEBA1|nr:peroxisome proliferator-activated receptor gamma coactivator 1-alpha isoform X10 [Pangasianodon hypophthalmus]
MAWDRCNQESVWTELECAALVGEDQPLCPDLPELDLSELDVSDLDADSFLGGLKWYSDQSEIISSQYGNESSNLFEKIDEENEANLLAVLTETLDSIPVDEDGLPSFEALADGDVTNASDQSCPSTPDGSPRTPEPEEPSLLKKLLLAPPNSQLSYNQYPGSKAQNHAASNHRIRPTPAVTKTDNPWNSKQRGICPQPNRLVRRPCTELLKYLTASDDAFQTRASETKSTWSGCEKDRGGPGTSSCSSSSSPSSSSTSSFSSLSSCSSSTASKKKPTSASLSTQQQQQQQQQLAVQAQRAKPTTLPLPLTPESPNDHKGSPFENKTIERTLSVEISGTPGLTPPTTPPHKASQENLFKVSLKTKLSSASSALTSKKAKLSNGSPSSLPFSSSSRKGHEKSELYAQLSKASSALPLGNLEECRGKRPTPRVFGDHDYCQASSTKRDNGTSAATITGPVEGRHVQAKDSTMPTFSNLTSSLSSTSPLSSSLARQLQGLCPMVQEACPDKEAQGQDHSPALGAKTSKECISAGRKLLRDQEIREELNKHFGNPQQAFFSETEQSGFQPLDESDSGDENYYPFEAYMDTGLPDFEDLDVGRERLLCSWEGTPLEMLFEGSPPCSPSSSLPSQSSVSPPSSLLSPRHFYNSQSGSRSRSRSRSSSRHRYRSLSRSPYSRSQSPDNCSPSWSHHTVDKSTFKSRTIRSPQSDSHSGLGQRPRYDSYEEYQHEQLQREEYQRDYEKREVERAEQREKQRKRAIEERRVLYVGRLRADSTRSELKRRFEVFGEIEECAINFRHNGDNFGFITYRYTCDAFAALENGHTLRRPNEPQFELCFGGQKQFCKSNYTDLDSHSEDFDPTTTKSKYDSMDFDSLLREAQCSLRR